MFYRPYVENKKRKMWKCGGFEENNKVLSFTECLHIFFCVYREREFHHGKY